MNPDETKLKIEGSEALLTGAQTACTLKGGIITITHSGQNAQYIKAAAAQSEADAMSSEELVSKEVTPPIASSQVAQSVISRLESATSSDASIEKNNVIVDDLQREVITTLTEDSNSNTVENNDSMSKVLTPSMIRNSVGAIMTGALLDSTTSSGVSESTNVEVNEGMNLLDNVAKNTDTLNKESDITYIYIDIDQYSSDVQKSIAEIQSGLEKYKNDEFMLEYLTSALDNILDYSAGWGKNIEIGKEMTRGVVSGGLQFVGGFTEMTTGAAIFTATSWTGVGIPIGLAGGYMAVDGFSNMTGGGSKAFNSLMMNDEADNFNFMKLGYKKISPEYGERIYNITQLGIGLFTLKKGIVDLSSDSVKFVPRAKQIAKAQSKGLATSTKVVDVGSQVVITTKTQSGMILQKTIVYKSKLTEGVLLIGVDGYNVDSAKDSIK